MIRSLRTLFAAACTALALAACGGDDLVSVQSPETITYAAALNVDLSTMTRSQTGLYTKDLVVGPGATATDSKILGVRYAGFLNDGTMFDSRSTGTFRFTLGNSQVIRGWDEGLVGMKVGGRRQLVIPASLGYGNAGSGKIPPGAVMIFVVDLITVDD